MSIDYMILMYLQTKTGYERNVGYINAPLSN
jgi:hypothetical protein